VQDVSKASGLDSVAYRLLDMELWTIILVLLLCSHSDN
jgi:hypothetical protein